MAKLNNKFQELLFALNVHHCTPAFFMEKVETDSLMTLEYQLLVWCHYIDYIFVIWTHGEIRLKQYLKELNDYQPSLKLTHEFSKKQLPFFKSFDWCF